MFNKIFWAQLYCVVVFLYALTWIVGDMTGAATLGIFQDFRSLAFQLQNLLFAGGVILTIGMIVWSIIYLIITSIDPQTHYKALYTRCIAFGYLILCALCAVIAVCNYGIEVLTVILMNLRVLPELMGFNHTYYTAEVIRIVWMWQMFVYITNVFILLVAALYWSTKSYKTIYA